MQVPLRPRNGKKRSRPGPLADLVANRQEKALDLLLLVYAVTVRESFDTAHWSTTWARAINGSYDTQSASAQVSRLWRQLEEHQLIVRIQSGRKVSVTKLREDGAGRPYTRPTGSETGRLGEIYFRLPYDYWRDGWNNRLTLPAKALLLIAMSRRDPKEFTLAEHWTSQWYGISEATVTRGRMKLEAEGIISVAREEQVPDLREMHGFGKRVYYKLEAPFDKNVRKGNGVTEGESSQKSKDPIRMRRVIIRK